MTAHKNQTTGLTNGRVANMAPEVTFHSFPSTFSTNVPTLLLFQPTISRGWKVQYIYSVNEVCGNDQPKRDVFFRLEVSVDKGQRLH